MSDENVGGLPPLSEEIQGFLNVHPFGYSHALGLLKRYARDAISAHGENASVQTPVVDAAMVSRAVAAFNDVYGGNSYKDKAMKAALIAALGDLK